MDEAPAERDPAKLAALRDRRCRSPLATIQQALVGSYREEYLFVLRQSESTWQRLRGDIAACGARLALLTQQVAAEAPGPLPAAVPRHPAQIEQKQSANGSL